MTYERFKRWIAPLLFIAIGLFAVYEGFFVLSFMTEKSGGTGLFPALVGILTTVSSFVWLVQEDRKYCASAAQQADAQQAAEDKAVRDGEEKKKVFSIDPGSKWMLITCAAGLAVVFLAKRLGMHFILAVFMLVFFRFISKYSWLKSILITLAASVVFYLIFSVWLGVFYPKFFGLF